MEAKEQLARLEGARGKIVPSVPGNPSIEELMEWIHAGGNVEDMLRKFAYVREVALTKAEERRLEAISDVS
jgi:hypothetical protein